MPDESSVANSDADPGTLPPASQDAPPNVSPPEEPAAAAGSTTAARRSRPAEPRRSRGDLLDGLRHRLGRFFVLLSSAAAVSTLLLFAGFLSDFAVYGLAGLPRLSLNVTSLVESGAGVLIDMLALLVASPWRIGTLAVGFALLVSAWSYSRTSLIRRLGRSGMLYHVARLGALVLAFLILAGEIRLVDRGVHPNARRADEAVAALRRAYKDSFPTPRVRQRELERTGYQVDFYPLPNWAEYWLDGASRKRMEGWDETVSGIPLRTLPESRDAANHVFGWIVLSLVVLTLTLVLLPLWKNLLDSVAATAADPPVPAGDESRVRRWWRRRLSAWVLRKLPTWIRPALEAPFEYLVVPLTALFTVLSLAVLPLCHGLLVRHWIGHESVLVLLKPDKVSASAEPAKQQEPARRQVHICMSEESRKSVSASADAYRSAVRDLIQVRPSQEQKHKEKRTVVRRTLADLVGAVIGADCPAAVQMLWQERPSMGLASADAELAEDFRNQSSLALEHYGARLGTILTYPREEQPLRLVDSIQPRSPTADGQWSLTAHGLDRILEIVVLSNVRSRKAKEYEGLLVRQPDNDALGPLLASQSPDAFATTLRLLEQHMFYVPHAGVAVTAIGGMAFSNAAERPDLTTRAIDLLADLASTGDNQAWPSKDKTRATRGAAMTALHLSRNPYAGARLAIVIDGESGQACESTAKGMPDLTRCLGQTITAAGFLLQDIVTEERRFPTTVPPTLQKPKDTLVRYLVETAVDKRRSDEHRSAACSALIQSGVRTLAPESRHGYFAAVSAMKPDEDIMAMPICVSGLRLLAMGDTEHREFLRRLVLEAPAQGVAQEPVERVRQIALITLSELGLGAESAFLFEAFTTAEPDQRARVGRYLDEADGLALGGLFTDCATTKFKTDEPGALICMDGLKRVADNYDGDEGGTQQIAAVLRQTSREPVQTNACGVLRTFEQRGGLLARRALDPGQGEFRKTCPQDQGNQGDQLQRLRELLEGLQTGAATPGS